MLKDGSDSVGVLGALNRVFLNIGLFSEEWLLHFNAAGRRQEDNAHRDRRRAEEFRLLGRRPKRRLRNMALFFLMSTAARIICRMRPGGAAYLTKDAGAVDARQGGVRRDAARAAIPASAPTPAPELDPDGCAGTNYLDCWNRYWAWTKTDDFKQKMTEIVLSADFLDGNYLSTELRVPGDAAADQRLQPARDQRDRREHLGQLLVAVVQGSSVRRRHHLVITRTPATDEVRMPAGGRGYTRVPSLISLWSTAPFLLTTPSATSRRTRRRRAHAAFQDGSSRCSGRRGATRLAVGQQGPGDNRQDTRERRTSGSGRLRSRVPAKAVTAAAGRDGDAAERGLQIGPIPAGTPIDLLANSTRSRRAPNAGQRLAYQARSRASSRA